MADDSDAPAFSPPGLSEQSPGREELAWTRDHAAWHRLGSPSLHAAAACGVELWRERTGVEIEWRAEREVVAPAGGQPGSGSAWLDPAVNRLTGGFTSGTLATIEAAYVRPRETWWPPFQLAAGAALNELLRRSAGPGEIYEEVERLYREALT
jgi:hypothetical protein